MAVYPRQLENHAGLSSTENPMTDDNLAEPDTEFGVMRLTELTYTKNMSVVNHNVYSLEISPASPLAGNSFFNAGSGSSTTEPGRSNYFWQDHR
jgi:hypothetical protein